MGILDRLQKKREAQPDTIPIKSLVQPPSTVQPIQPIQPPTQMQTTGFVQPIQYSPPQKPSYQQPQSAYPQPVYEEPAPKRSATGTRAFEESDREVLGSDREDVPTVISRMDDAPVFVKIDKYEEILSELSSVKGTIQNIQNAIEIFNIIREVESDAISILDGLSKEMERSQIKLDKVLGRFEDVKERVKESRYEREKSSKPEGLSTIEERIRRLRDEIKKLEK